MLAEHTGMHRERCQNALRWLVKKGLVYYGNDEYRVNEAGRAYHAACQARPLMGLEDFARWKAEALSGMDEKGEPTKIENPVIPKGKE